MTEQPVPPPLPPAPRTGAQAAKPPANGSGLADGLGGRDLALITLGIVVCLGVLAAGVLVAGAIMGDGRRLFAPSVGLVFGAVVVQTAILVGCVYGLGLRRRRLPWSAVGFRPASLRWCVAAVLLGVAFLFVLDAVEHAIETPLPELVGRVLAPEGFSWTGMAAMVAAGGLLAPVGEEMLYRGVLYGWLRRRWGPVAGAVISAVIFGISHWNPYWAAFVAVMGVVLAVVYEKSGSLWPPILLHMSYNCTGIVVLYASIR